MPRARAHLLDLDVGVQSRTSSVEAIVRMPILPMQRGQKLINAREKTPEKLDVRQEAQREYAGQRAVPTHETR